MKKVKHKRTKYSSIPSILTVTLTMVTNMDNGSRSKTSHIRHQPSLQPYRQNKNLR